MQGRSTTAGQSDKPPRRGGPAHRLLSWRWLATGLLGLAAVEGYSLVEEHFFAGNRLGVVVAEDAKPAAKPATAEKSTPKPVVTNTTPLSDSELATLKTLEKRRDALDLQEKEIKRREERIKLAEKSLDAKLEELKKLRTEITALFEQEKQARDERMQMMVQTICINMKPDQSAAILANMEDEIVLRMFGMIPDKQLSRILEKMDKKKAAELTAAYVKQKKTMPKPPEK